jgi:hypothetical protein
VKQPPTSPNGKPILDEESFQQLLSAAYVVQKQLGQEPEASRARILSEILETQGQIRGMRLDLRAATVLIARRVRELSTASGAAVGILDDGQLEYYAASGSAASEAGWHAPPDSTLAAECLHTGGIVQSPDAENDARLRSDLCRSLGVKAFIAAPAVHAGKVAGVLEMHFSQANAFQEHDIRTCQLMATLVAEAITSDAEPEMKPSAATGQRSAGDGTSMPMATKPAANKVSPRTEHPAGPSAFSAAEPPYKPRTVPAPETAYCTCGNQLDKNDLYCGTCGRARPARDAEGRITQSTWASLWDMQRKEESAKDDSGKPKDSSAGALDVLPSELEEIVAKFSTEPFESSPADTGEAQLSPFAAELSEEVPHADSGDQDSASDRIAGTIPPPATTPATQGGSSLLAFESPRPERSTRRMQASIRPPAADTILPSSSVGTPAQTAEDYASEQTDHSSVPSLSQTQSPPAGDFPWGSARKTKEWLEAQRQSGGWLVQTWRAQRANIYLAASVLLLIAVLAGWGAPPSSGGAAEATATAKQHKAPPKPDLTFTEKVLIDLGLAEAPPPPVDMGNPNVKVWIDVHTALYYCQGEDMYGKTTDGKVTTQGEAQRDQFQPAARTPCK